MLKSKRSIFRVFSGLFILSATCLIVLGQDSTTSPLKKVLNGKGYMLASPAISWPYPGGFLVAGKDSTTFIDLPPAVTKPAATNESADFPAVKQTKSFSLSAILTGMQTLIGGNPGLGAGHTSSLSFQELNAPARRITYQQAANILQNSEVKTAVTQWLKKDQVFIVGISLTTTAISVSADSSTNLDLSFNGSPVSKCVSPASATGASGASGKGGANGGSGTSVANAATKSTRAGNAAAKATGAAAAVNGKAAAGAGGASGDKSGAAVATGPGGELHFCSSSSNSVTMKTTAPLVFAVAAYKISKGASGDLELEPSFSLAKGSVESTTDSTVTPAYERVAATIPTTWMHTAKWPGAR